jgi:AcrR family transcriptional regulator
MGYRHDRDDLLRAGVELALEQGLGALTFGRVGKRLGISDRTVVYYFPTKEDLATAVAAELGLRLQALLEEAFGPDPMSVPDLLARAWPVLAAPPADPVFAVFFEAIGLASAGQAPWVDLVPVLVDGWVDWLVPRVRGGTTAERRRSALAIVAQLDGLLLVRQAIGARAANTAAREMGILGA